MMYDDDRVDTCDAYGEGDAYDNDVWCDHRFKESPKIQRKGATQREAR